MCKLKRIFELSHPYTLPKKKNESQRCDLTYLRSHTSRDAIFIWLGFYHSTSVPWNLAQIPWDRSQPEAKITFQNFTFTSMPTLQALSLPIEHPHILLIFFLFPKWTFFFYLVHHSGGLSKYQPPTRMDTVKHILSFQKPRQASREASLCLEFKAGAGVNSLGWIWKRLVLILLNTQWVYWRFWSFFQGKWPLTCGSGFSGCQGRLGGHCTTCFLCTSLGTYSGVVPGFIILQIEMLLEMS